MIEWPYQQNRRVSVNYVGKQREAGGGLAKFQQIRNYIVLCSKLVNKGVGVKNPANVVYRYLFRLDGSKKLVLKYIGEGYFFETLKYVMFVYLDFNWVQRSTEVLLFL